MAGWLATAWGIIGVLALLGNAIARLAPRAVEALGSSLGALELAVLAVWIVFMGYAEGWRGFHKRFSPKVVARAFHLQKELTPVRGLFAPLYCMSLFGATKRARIVAWSLLTGIVALVLLVRLAPQPWRGIIDAGVVLGLAIGSASIVYFVIRALRDGPSEPPDLPER